MYLKEKILLLIFCFTSCLSFTQNYITSNNLKRGIYRNFDEFRYNKPLEGIPFEIVEDIEHSKYGVIKTKKNQVFQISILPNHRDSINMIYGFCDGRIVFLNKDGELKPYNAGNHFVKVKYLGGLSYFKKYITSTENTQVPSSNGTMANSGSVKTESFKYHCLFLETGQIFEINKKFIENLLKDDPSLFNLYKDEPKKSNIETMKLYITYYSQRNESKLNGNKVNNDLESKDDKELKNNLKKQNSKEERLKYFNNNLFFDSTNSNYEAYLENIYNWENESEFLMTRLKQETYANGNIKKTGVVAKHKLSNNSDYFYKIGTWKTFHKNGNIESILNYNLEEDKTGEYYFYNEKGVISKRGIYKSKGENELSTTKVEEKKIAVKTEKKETKPWNYGSEGRRMFYLNRLQFTEKDSSFEEYKKRVLLWKKDPVFKDLIYIEKRNSKGIIKVRGFNALHELELGNYVHRNIGTWQYFSNLGKLQKEIDYNLKGQKHGYHILYNSVGKIMLSEEYINGKKVN